MNIHERLAALGAAVPEVLLPGPGTELEKWAVIACDQFTQDRDFWAQTEQAVGTAPSALRLIFPEVYLEDDGRRERIAAIHQAMKNYLAGGVFAPPRRCCVYIERATPYHPVRRGLVIAVDLERYDWTPGAKSLIRATEGTVKERIPPRMEIRRGAPLESPHILLLIDDEPDSLLPALGRRAKAAAPLYRTALSPGAGSVSGWALDAEADWELLAGGLEELARRAGGRYGGEGANDEPFLFAAGDGNHSLATAKAVWEEYKAAHAGASDLENHPARWALVELENLYDPGIAFEPIHRIVFGVGLDEVLETLSVLPGFSTVPVGIPPFGDAYKTALRDRAELSRLVGDARSAKNRLGLIAGATALLVETDAPGLATGYLQPLLDALVRERQRLGAGIQAVSGRAVTGTSRTAAFEEVASGETSVSIDYIHGEEELFRLAGAEDNAVSPGGTGPVGILLPPIRKGGLFETVARSGALPRKSFSMGEACEKRFYLECRKLFG